MISRYFCLLDDYVRNDSMTDLQTFPLEPVNTRGDARLTP